MTTQAERSASTRQVLIDAAATLLSEQGYAAFGEARVCEAAGVSRGSLRHHFPAGRYDLLPAMVAFLIERQAARQEALGPLPAAVRLRLMLLSLIQQCERHSALAIFEVWMATRGDTRLAETAGPLIATVQERLYGGEPGGSVDPELLTLQLLLHGATVQCFVANYDRARLADAVQWLLDRLPPPKGFSEVLSRTIGGLRQ